MHDKQERLTLFSPAKINLFFRVLHKRSDGYHEIASLYQAISLGDLLTVSLAKKDLLTCTDPTLPCDKSNLVNKALHIFREKTGEDFCVHFHLEKKTPVQAGLGGGSSNAATALWALNSFLKEPVDSKTLASWAATFSSDAPFFFSSGTAYCTGRGEFVRDVGAIAPFVCQLVKPEVGLSTPLVYKHCIPDILPIRDPHDFLQRALQGDLRTFNDLECSAFQLLPELAELKVHLLQQGFEQVTMTGSGTAFMCFGNAPCLSVPSARCFPISSLNRDASNWYKSPSL